jgi:hypothetical protein
MWQSVCGKWSVAVEFSWMQAYELDGSYSCPSHGCSDLYCEYGSVDPQHVSISQDIHKDMLVSTDLQKCCCVAMAIKYDISQLGYWKEIML